MSDDPQLADDLAILATAIHRNKKRNWCWLAGEAIHVEALERVLARFGVQTPKDSHMVTKPTLGGDDA